MRTWTAFHHHVAVCMFAHAFAATRKARLHTTAGPTSGGERNDGDPADQGAHQGNGLLLARSHPSQPAPTSPTGGSS